jgi:hypothetical protein
MLTAALFIIAKTQKTAKCTSTHKGINKIYIHIMDYYSAMKWNEVLRHAILLSYHNIMLREKASQREGYISYNSKIQRQKGDQMPENGVERRHEEKLPMLKMFSN